MKPERKLENLIKRERDGEREKEREREVSDLDHVAKI